MKKYDLEHLFTASSFSHVAARFDASGKEH